MPITTMWNVEAAEGKEGREEFGNVTFVLFSSVPSVNSVFDCVFLGQVGSQETKNYPKFSNGIEPPPRSRGRETQGTQSQ